MANAPSRGAESSAPAFGLARQRTARIEIVFALKSGNLMTVYQAMPEPVTEESLTAFARELTEQLNKKPEPRAFADEWNASGQHAWINLADVAAFSLRPAR